MRLPALFRRSRFLRYSVTGLLFILFLYLILAWMDGTKHYARDVINSQFSAQSPREAPKLIPGNLICLKVFNLFRLPVNNF